METTPKVPISGAGIKMVGTQKVHLFSHMNVYLVSFVQFDTFAIDQDGPTLLLTLYSIFIVYNMFVNCCARFGSAIRALRRIPL